MKNLVYLSALLCTLVSHAQTRLYPYSDGHLWGLTNASRAIVAAPQFDTSFFFNDRPFAIARKNNKYGTIDQNGKSLAAFVYDNISALAEDFGIGTLNGKFLLLNMKTGKPATPQAFDRIGEYCYCAGKLFIVTTGGKKMIINGTTGRQLGKAAYEDAEFFRDFGPRALVKTGGKYGLINTQTAAWVIPAKYDQISNEYHNGQEAIAATVGSKTVYLDSSGKALKEDATQTGMVAEETMVSVEETREDDQQWKDLYIYNLGGNSWKLSLESRRSGGTKVFQTYDLKGYTLIEKISYNGWDEKMPAILKAVKEGKTGLIGLNGEVLVPFQYDNIVKTSGQSCYKATLNNLVGVWSNKLVEIKKPVFKQVLAEDNSLNAILVEMPGSQRGYMDVQTGKIYIPGIED